MLLITSSDLINIQTWQVGKSGGSGSLKSKNVKGDMSPNSDFQRGGGGIKPNIFLEGSMGSLGISNQIQREIQRNKKCLTCKNLERFTTGQNGGFHKNLWFFYCTSPVTNPLGSTFCTGRKIMRSVLTACTCMCECLLCEKLKAVN